MFGSLQAAGRSVKEVSLAFFPEKKEAASSHLAHYEKPLINLFKQVISLIHTQWLHFLCIPVLVSQSAALLGSGQGLGAVLPAAVRPPPGVDRPAQRLHSGSTGPQGFC